MVQVAGDESGWRLWRRGKISGEDSGRGSVRRPTRDHGPSWAERHWTSRAVQVAGEWSSNSMAGIVVAALVGFWVGVGFVKGFGDSWQAVLYSVSSAITLVMVFAIQHTQAREQSATQRKLDELLRALPGTDAALVSIEEAPDEELQEMADQHHALRSETLAPNRS